MKTKSSASLIAIAFVLMTASPQTKAVVPTPDGCYPNYTTAEGCNALSLLSSGAGNTGVGWYSLFSAGTGNYNTGVGAGTLVLNTADSNTAVGAAALLLNTTGTLNVAVGTDALVHNDHGSGNNAVGAFALFYNLVGDFNNALGNEALFYNCFGNSNTAIGDFALHNNDMSGAGVGGFNTAVGAVALANNIDGASNTAIGDSALFNNDITGNGVANNNTAVGAGALFSNTDGNLNTAVGWEALFSNDTGLSNTAVGAEALREVVDGFNNTAIGENALPVNISGLGNTAIGRHALFNTTGNANIAVGAAAGQDLTTGELNIDIGNPGVAGESNTIRIGNTGVHTATYIAGISGQTASAGVAVYVNGSGQLGTLTSSARFKTEIKPMDKTSEAILALKPVSFRYKKEIDPERMAQFGLVAEEVEKVNPDLVARNAKGEVYTVRYEAVNAMLLNEFLKEHHKVEEQQAAMAKLESVVAQQQNEFRAAMAGQKKEMENIIARLKQQDAKIQTANDRIELTKSAHQAFVTNR